MDQSRRLTGSNSERAIEIVKRLEPKQVYIYAMGREPWMSHVMAMGYTENSIQLVESRKLLAHCREREWWRTCPTSRPSSSSGDQETPQRIRASLMTERLYRLADATLAEPLVNDVGGVVDDGGARPLQPAPEPVPGAAAQGVHPGAGLPRQVRARPRAGRQLVRDVPPSRAGEVKALLQRTLAEQGDRIQFAEALEEFQGWLWAEAKGQALEPLYPKVPAPLRGLVELVYDYGNRPTVRFLEPFHVPQPLLQAGAAVAPALHAGVGLLAAGLYSTAAPCRGPAQLDLRVPFADERLDRLFALDLEPRPLSHVRDLLGPAALSDEGGAAAALGRAAARGRRARGAGGRASGTWATPAYWWSGRGVSILTDAVVGAASHPGRDGAALLPGPAAPDLTTC